jgi:mRNA-degrading endonuclease RelE of RelBE toxin-antitoxin system
MTWTVNISGKVRKTVDSLPKAVAEQLIFLIREIESLGPVRGNWPNYGKLDRNRHHCHLKKGKPTYVAVWEVRDRTVRLVEITYAGTHEKAPY